MRRTGDKLFKFPFEVPEGHGVVIADEPARYDPMRLGKRLVCELRCFLFGSSS
jgi:hypothetical protein